MTQYSAAIVVLLGAFFLTAHPAKAEPFKVGGAAVAREFGSMRGDYFVPNALVREQINMGLGIPEEPQLLLDGNYLVSGCRPHSCIEKAAIIATPGKRILASGLIYFHWQEGVEGGCLSTDCDIPSPRLIVFAKKGNLTPAILKELQDWARRVAKIETTAEVKLIP